MSADQSIDPAARRVEAAIAELIRIANNPEAHRRRQQAMGTDLSATELEALRNVDDLGPIDVTRSAQVLGLSIAAASRTLGRLDQRGLLVREAHPEDGRIVWFRTTPAGAELRRRFQESTLREVAAVLRDWPSRDRTALAELFGRLVEQMQR
jgi:DNA-binding MarR family transcriptional regulator